MPVDRHSEDLLMANNHGQTRRKRTERSRRQVILRINVFPDDVLLEIFDFYMKKNSMHGKKASMKAWQLLVHVCRRWRNLVFGSPRRLNLQLFCTPQTPARDTQDLWPALPLVVEGYMDSSTCTDNVVAALSKHSDRVCRVDLSNLAGSQLEQVLAAMQVPFPELTDLQLFSDGEKTLPVIPNSSMIGSAPHLRIFALDGIPFPGLPNLHLSATHLVNLRLFNIPHSGYISPEAIAALLSMLTSLEGLSLLFQTPQSCPDQETRRPPPSKRSVLPALENFHFKGVIEYLEDLLTDIDAPQLDEMHITFFNQIDFDTPLLAQFINRTPKLTKREARVQFYDNLARVRLPPAFRSLEIGISCKEPDWQLSSIEQVCKSSLHPLSSVEDLYIEHRYRRHVWKDEAIENTQWLQLLLPFTAVKNLYLSKEFSPSISVALKELVGGRITEVLPTLQNIFVERLKRSGPFRENIGQFIAARQVSGHSITISVWHK